MSLLMGPHVSHWSSTLLVVAHPFEGTHLVLLNISLRLVRSISRRLQLRGSWWVKLGNGNAREVPTARSAVWVPKCGRIQFSLIVGWSEAQ